MNWFERFKQSWDREFEAYYKGVAAGKEFMSGNPIALPDDLKGTKYARVFASGMSSGIKHYKELKRMDEAKG